MKLYELSVENKHSTDLMENYNSHGNMVAAILDVCLENNITPEKLIENYVSNEMEKKPLKGTDDYLLMQAIEKLCKLPPSKI